ncbi:Serum response factor [Amphibalanus amphitrite]|uniref:Serum response factor homolog n=1 Tax=Amphibalanus amphitrite TaxID=1232801 RepID=A0A6A4VZB4_AMPAM|nr:Serum response factor [Amphibalanus amphitrite]
MLKLNLFTSISISMIMINMAYELSTLTGTQVMLLVASETGHVYTFATRKLQPMITSEAGKALIQTCLNSPDPAGAPPGPGDQRMSATGFEETELCCGAEDEQKVRPPLAQPLAAGYGEYRGLAPPYGGYSGQPQACWPLPPQLGGMVCQPPTPPVSVPHSQGPQAGLGPGGFYLPSVCR